MNELLLMAYKSAPGLGWSEVSPTRIRALTQIPSVGNLFLNLERVDDRFVLHDDETSWHILTEGHGQFGEFAEVAFFRINENRKFSKEFAESRLIVAAIGAMTAEIELAAAAVGEIMAYVELREALRSASEAAEAAEDAAAELDRCAGDLVWVEEQRGRSGKGNGDDSGKPHPNSGDGEAIHADDVGMEDVEEAIETLNEAKAEAVLRSREATKEAFRVRAEMVELSRCRLEKAEAEALLERALHSLERNAHPEANGDRLIAADDADQAAKLADRAVREGKELLGEVG